MSAQPVFELKKEKKANKSSEPTQKQSSVRVICRIKPLGQNQQGIDIKIDKNNSQISISQPRKDTIKTFTFNRVFTDETQQKFVSEICQSILHENFKNKKGYLIFSYGVTNSGKTHTILGSQNQLGILPYLVRHLSQQQQVYLSAIQLYNDQFFSLSTKQKLYPRQINGFLDFSHYSISQRLDPSNMDRIFKLYLFNRTQNQTKNNNKSSRSHAIFRIKIREIIIGVIDLAGSQRTHRVFATIDQTTNINKSLLCLGKCIKALKQNPESQQLIPYRESKLTKVLIEYFMSRVQVTMIVNINQSQSCFHQNMKVLDYAVLAKDIQHYTTQSSYKKQPTKSSNKLDIFETLYKSATKQLNSYRKQKISRTKLFDKSTGKQISHHKKFARILKTQQLQLYIQKFNSSHQTFQYLVDYMQTKQLEEDSRRIQNISILNYQSPFIKTNNDDQKQYNDVALVPVSRGELSIELMKEKIRNQMRQQLRILLQQQRLNKMENKQTQITQSFSKQSQLPPKQPSCPTATPQKLQKIIGQSGFIKKTSNLIVSSIKKILSKNVQSVKKMIPRFMRQQNDHEKKLVLCNYGEQFQALFKIENPHHQRPSQHHQNLNQSKFNNVSEQNNKPATQQIQNEKFEKETKQISTKNNSERLQQSSEECSQRETLTLTVKDCQISIDSPSNKQSSSCQQIDSNQSSQPQIKRVKQVKKYDNKSRKELLIKKYQFERQVAFDKKRTVMFQRSKSRTPIRQRLRSYANH